MKYTFAFQKVILFTLMVAVTCVCLSSSIATAASQSSDSTASTGTTTGAEKTARAATFATPEEAADALVNAAETFEESTLIGLVGSQNSDLLITRDSAQDRERAKNFVALAREKKTVTLDPKTHQRAFLLVGKDDWPFPLPIVKTNNKWAFDAKAGRREILKRRIGGNELDAIEVCRGYVEAQYEYALKPRQGYDVNQFAQKIISTPGTQDGLAWRDPDGSWHGPAGENVARAIQAGYSQKTEPYHGYFFKILKRQGPAAPLGAMNFVVKGVMIGGFALVAAPADYGETGIKSFIVGYDGVVYEKDLGPTTLDQFKKMEVYNPDKSWQPVPEG